MDSKNIIFDKGSRANLIEYVVQEAIQNALEEIDKNLIEVVKVTFKQNKCVYGHKKLLKALRKKGVSIGKEKLSRIMKDENLVSKYVKRRKPKTESPVNNDKIDNKVDRRFNDRKPLEVVASDLTYVDVNNKWHYICLLIELSHREIIGFSAGKNKDAELRYVRKQI